MFNKLKLYQRLFLFAEKKHKKEHMKQYGTDIKCPNCNEWFSTSSIKHNHNHVDPQPWFGSHVRCGQCGHDSYWNLMIAPVAIRCDEKGNPP